MNNLSKDNVLKLEELYDNFKNDIYPKLSNRLAEHLQSENSTTNLSAQYNPSIQDVLESDFNDLIHQFIVDLKREFASTELLEKSTEEYISSGENVLKNDILQNLIINHGDDITTHSISALNIEFNRILEFYAEKNSEVPDEDSIESILQKTDAIIFNENDSKQSDKNASQRVQEILIDFRNNVINQAKRIQYTKLSEDKSIESKPSETDLETRLYLCKKNSEKLIESTANSSLELLRKASERSYTHIHSVIDSREDEILNVTRAPKENIDNAPKSEPPKFPDVDLFDPKAYIAVQEYLKKKKEWEENHPSDNLNKHTTNDGHEQPGNNNFLPTDLIQ